VAKASRVSNTIDKLRADYVSAQRAIEALRPRDMFVAATQLRDVLDELRRGAAGLRAVAVDKIRDDEDLSMRGLADELGLTASRIQQLVQQAAEQERHDNG
jgi:hypothetical protein